jgi:hypothetical protein
MLKIMIWMDHNQRIIKEKRLLWRIKKESSENWHKGGE